MDFQAMEGAPTYASRYETPINSAIYQLRSISPEYRGYKLITDAEGNKNWYNPNTDSYLSAAGDIAGEYNPNSLAAIDAARANLRENWSNLQGQGENLNPLNYDQMMSLMERVKNSPEADFITDYGAYVTPGTKVYNADKSGYFTYEPATPDGRLGGTAASEGLESLWGGASYGAGGPEEDMKNWKWNSDSGAPAPDWQDTMRQAGVFTQTQQESGGFLGRGGLNAVKAIGSMGAAGLGAYLSAGNAATEGGMQAGELAAAETGGVGGGLKGQVLDAIARGNVGAIAPEATTSATGSFSNPLGLDNILTAGEASLATSPYNAAAGIARGGDMFGSTGLDLMAGDLPTPTPSFMESFNAGNYGEALGNLPWEKIAPTALGAATSLYGAVSASNAADRNAEAIRNSAAMEEKARQEALASGKPWYELGLSALDAIKSGDVSGIKSLSSMRGPSYDEVVPQYDINNPAYAELQRQRREQLNEQLSARGLLRGAVGANLINDQERKLAAEEYEKKLTSAKERYAALKAEKNDDFSRLFSLAGMGQTQQSQAANIGMQGAQNQANATLAGAQNQTAAQQNMFNALTAGAGLGLKAYSTMNQPQGYWNTNPNQVTGGDGVNGRWF
jgi:hypothetical protein